MIRCSAPANRRALGRRPHAPAARWLGLLVLACVLAACGTTPALTEAPAIDLPRFMGRWHVISHVPYFGERGHVASVDEFTLRADRDIGVRYFYRTGFSQPLEMRVARATVAAGTGNREWTAWLLRVAPAKYRILEVAPDYTWALVAHPDSDLAWILAREPVMDDALYADLERHMRRHGVNTDKLRRVPQVPEQVGKLGFADPEHP